MSVQDLIGAISAGNAIEIETQFNKVMAEKISDRIDDMRVQVAQNMFSEEVENSDEELNLEDYSLEDLQDFMMSEDFEQLDELSKKTLGSYVKKASADAINKATDKLTK